MKERFFYERFTVEKVLCGSFSLYEKNASFEFITSSSLEADENSLFAALTGTSDGHMYIRHALQKGASFIAERNNPYYMKLSSAEKKKGILVDSTRNALQALGQFHRSRFSPLVIAVTGSSGKTTTKELIAGMLKFLGAELVFTEKNYNNEIGAPFTVFKLNEKTKAAVFELGMNHKGEIERLSQMTKPDIALVTNVGPAHIEFLGSLKNIASAKAEICAGMNGGTLFIPDDVLYPEEFYESAARQNVTVKTFGMDENSHLKNIQDIGEKGFSFSIGKSSVLWPMPGKRLLKNVSGAVSAVTMAGVQEADIAAGISEYQAEGMRGIIEKNFFTVLNDCYNANSDSVKSSLEAAKQISEKRKVYAVLGDMKELGEFSKGFHEETGKFAAEIELNGLIGFGTDSEYTVSEFKRNSPRAEFAFCRNDSDESCSEIAEFLKQNVPENSVILVKGSRSMKMERITKKLQEIK
ncbi:MAG TPA: UDP-N-acetylmuramoyl-tripeptide--D-alanyl-D-alanine ligase [Leptospiraceae bacterium]|nr:UDP-N-acetylmuramoyl-tripeptide--D-alanyl-D-alanine ligase [Leptospiraceae bacterium]HNF14061.1 UDP-N-acetylmuramoyl-tripeptide--D-alanyl-D-alanine ligase [Leptospiraceae bacterium]HNF25200.1 UDP-N-acetylmuramoyl-tripeptide--D-alanyl-D-alanine ligase [Leptospiraceae bacterium]HNI95867.1 UDP-N-acetylmuramoyl-tripeptide--D-alanyl-D-alanine ligase [Leptospiraceae bacterium]HNO22000.1 UDP-N-acetylmuramoyl-tripeptide--D-alanyl-D-alanine ligase [Leptospiraceae bacterium]